MKKVLVIIPDSNKGKFISKGFISAFKELSFFTYEMKVYDLNMQVINKISPDIIFIFWSDLKNKEFLQNFPVNYSQNSDFIHCSEYIEDIPKQFHKLKSHYIFSLDSKKQKNKYIQPVSVSDYKSAFECYRYKITFTGNPSYSNREIILSELVKNFGGLNIFCRSFDFYKSVENISQKKLLNKREIEIYRKSYSGYVETTKDLANIYAQSKINIDIKNEKEKNINYRVLEITASGGFVIAPYNENIVKYFDDGKEIETYKDIYELVDKINFYLKNIEITKGISLNGKENTASNFSYNDKLKAMLKVIYGKDFSSR